MPEDSFAPFLYPILAPSARQTIYLPWKFVGAIELREKEKSPFNIVGRVIANTVCILIA
jgi:hypothetical protein